MREESQQLKISLVLSKEKQRKYNLVIAKVNGIFKDNKEIYYIPSGRTVLTVMAGNRVMMNRYGKFE